MWNAGFVYTSPQLSITAYSTAQKMKFSIKDFSSNCEQIRSFLRIWSHLLEKSLVENFIFCAVLNSPSDYFESLPLHYFLSIFFNVTRLFNPLMLGGNKKVRHT